MAHGQLQKVNELKNRKDEILLQLESQSKKMNQIT
jgi:hypothetical protein